MIIAAVFLKLLAVITVIKAEFSCKSGYSCYQDNNRDVTWVKEDAETISKSCDFICNDGLLIDNEGPNYICDNTQSLIYDVNSFNDIAQGLGFECEPVPEFCGNGSSGMILISDDNFSSASKRCYFPDIDPSQGEFDCEIILEFSQCSDGEGNIERKSIICPCKLEASSLQTPTESPSQDPTNSPTNNPSSTTPQPMEKRFTINNDPDQYVQISDKSAFLENSRDLLQCDLNNEETKYIIMNQDSYNKIKDKEILLMKDDIFEDVNLSPECKYPVLKILNEPSPESLPNNEIKIYVTTDVVMTDYIDDINVDLDELEMVFLDPEYVSGPSEDMDPSQLAVPYKSMENMEFEDATVEEIEYDIECTANCEEYDENEYSYWLQLEYEDRLKEEISDKSVVSNMIAEQIGGNVNRRRLGFFSWFKRKIIRPAVRVVKKVVKVVKEVVKTVVQIVTGNVDITKDYGIDINKKKSNKFTSKYKYKKDNLKVDVEGNLDIEYGVKFQLKLFSKLKAKWTIVPPKFEHFRFTVGGTTEFLTWVKAQISASADIEMLLFEKKKSFKFMLGPVPVIVTLEANLKMKLETEISAQFMQQIGYKPLSVEFGVEYINNEWKSISDINLQFELINNKEFKWNGDSDGTDIECPLSMNIDLFLIPRFQLTLYKVVYAAIEEEFKLINSYDIADSCIDGKDVCDIISDNDNKLGLTAGLNVVGHTNVILGAKIEIFGLTIAKKEWRFPINSLSFDKHLGETCDNFPDSLDSVFKNGICHCDGIDHTQDSSNKYCVKGFDFDFNPNGEYEIAGIRNNAPYWKQISCQQPFHSGQCHLDKETTLEWKEDSRAEAPVHGLYSWYFVSEFLEKVDELDRSCADGFASWPTWFYPQHCAAAGGWLRIGVTVKPGPCDSN